MPHADVCLLDGPNLAHRAWWAAGADPFQARVTLTSFVRTAVTTHTATHAAVGFDAPSCFRTAIFPEYKANRPPKVAAMADWMNALRGLDAIAGVRVVVAEKHEADDVLATLAREVAEAAPHATTLLFTADSDAYALVTDRCAVALLSSGSGSRYMNRAAVKAKLGVWPHQITAYKALSGDKTDNVGGCPGVGPKHAVALLDRYGDLATAVAALTRPPVRGDLDVARDAVRLAYRVVQPCTRAPVRWHLSDLRVRTAPNGET